jgi:adenosylcobinamide-phosphate synthase
MYYWFHQSFYMAKALPFIGGWLADRLFGDPEGHIRLLVSAK